MQNPEDSANDLRGGDESREIGAVFEGLHEVLPGLRAVVPGLGGASGDGSIPMTPSPMMAMAVKCFQRLRSSCI